MGKSIRSKIKKHHRTLKREAWGPIFAQRDDERAKLMTANIVAQRNADSKDYKAPPLPVVENYGAFTFVITKEQARAAELAAATLIAEAEAKAKEEKEAAAAAAAAAAAMSGDSKDSKSKSKAALKAAPDAAAMDDDGRPAPYKRQSRKERTAKYKTTRTKSRTNNNRTIQPAKLKGKSKKAGK